MGALLSRAKFKMSVPKLTPRDFDNVFLITKLYYKSKQKAKANLPEPMEWLADAKFHNAKWLEKKAELIACENYNPSQPLEAYCELMVKWSETHKLQLN